MDAEDDLEEINDNGDQSDRDQGLTTANGSDAGAHLRPIHVLGARMCGRQIVEFINETHVVYPVAHHVGLYHTENRTMEFFQPTNAVQSIQSFHVSTNKELVAVAEVHHASVGLASATTPLKVGSSSLVSQQQHVLSIYRVNNKTRHKMITLPHNSSIVSCAFSSDNKFLAMLEDAPTHNVTYWKVSTGKMIASCKCPSRGLRIFINPNNPNYISVSGPMILKYWLWTNNDFKIGNFLPQTREQEHFVDHLWLKEYMVAVSERGMLLSFRATSDYSGVDLVHASRCHQPTFVRLECLAAHAKGFVLGGSAGYFSLYEYSDDPKDPFAFVRTVSVGDIAFECITVSPNLETVVACTKSQDLLTFSMNSVETVQEDRIDYKELRHHGNQVGPILQVDLCILRQVIATIGADKTVRIWNYALRQYEVMHQCADEPIALSLHPTGYKLIVSFKERLRIYQLLQESLRQVRELPVKSCRAVRYSNGGHLFACAAGLTVSVFRTYTCDVLYTLSGHIGAVKALSWTKDDFYLYSGAHDGSIYRWNVSTGSRCEDVQHLVKQCQYSTLVSDERDPKVVFAAGTDCKIRALYGGEETHSVDLPGTTSATAMVITRDSKRLFVGTSTGVIMVFALPLTGKRCAFEFCAHAEPITFMRLTHDGETLVTASEDGCVTLFKVMSYATVSIPSASQLQDDSYSGSDVNDAPRGQDKKKAALSISDAVLVAREDIEEQRAALVEKQQQYDQVKADVEFTMHRKENEWIDRLRIIKEESEAVMIQERVRYEELEQRHQQAQRKHAETISNIEANHVKMTQELENQYERKLAQEMARYDALSETLEQTRQRCEALIEAQDTQNRNILHAERKTAYTRSKEQNDVIKRLHEDLRYNHVKFEEVLHQEETDYEQELYKIRADYEKQLDLERQNTAVKQGQLSACNTKLESLKKKMQELKASSHARDILLATERAKISKLEATLVQYERHFDACKFSMSDKDKDITSLKSTNRVLENFRSVLHHRIDNLEAAKAPMQDHMSSLESHIHDMQTELADEYQMKAVIQQDIENKDTKIKMLLHEVKMLRQNTLKKEYSMSEMIREFTRLAQMTNVKDIEAAIKDAYKTFVMGETVQKKLRPVATVAIEESRPHTGSPLKNKQVSPSPTNRAARGSVSGSGVASSPSRAAGKTENAKPSTSHNSGAAPSKLTDEALGYDCKQAVDESVQQMEYMSKTITTLRTALENAKAKADRVRRDAVAEGSQLIEECNKLRKENKIHVQKIRELEHQVYSQRERAAVVSPAKLESHLIASASTPLLVGANRQDHELVLDSSTPGSKLIPLSSPSVSAIKGPGSLRSPARNPKREKPGVLLPYAKVEQDRATRLSGAAKAEELSAIILQQKRDIQRLQMQVQLLMNADEQDTRPASTESLPDESRFKTPTKTSRVGALRPITIGPSAQPLQASFILKPTEAVPENDLR